MTSTAQVYIVNRPVGIINGFAALGAVIDPTGPLRGPRHLFLLAPHPFVRIGMVDADDSGGTSRNGWRSSDIPSKPTAAARGEIT